MFCKSGPWSLYINRSISLLKAKGPNGHLHRRNRIESASLRKRPHDHRLTDEAYLSAITVTKISQSFSTYKMAAKVNWHRYWTKLRHCHPMYMHCAQAVQSRTIRKVRDIYTCVKHVDMLLLTLIINSLQVPCYGKHRQIHCIWICNRCNVCIWHALI